MHSCHNHLINWIAWLMNSNVISFICNALGSQTDTIFSRYIQFKRKLIVVRAHLCLLVGLQELVHLVNLLLKRGHLVNHQREGIQLHQNEVTCNVRTYMRTYTSTPSQIYEAPLTYTSCAYEWCEHWTSEVVSMSIYIAVSLYDIMNMKRGKCQYIYVHACDREAQPHVTAWGTSGLYSANTTHNFCWPPHSAS